MADSLLDEELLDILGQTAPTSGSHNEKGLKEDSKTADQSPRSGKTSRAKQSSSGGSATVRKPKQQQKKKKKRRRNGSDDDEDDDDDLLSDFDEDYERSSDIDLDLDGSTGGKRKNRRGKKQQSISDSDDEDGDGLTEEERRLLQEPGEAELVGLTELEREQKLADWADKKQALLEKIQIKRRLKRQQSTTSDSASRNDVRAKHKSKLEELRAKRSSKKKSSESGSVYVDDEDDEDYADRIKSAYSKEGHAESKQLELRDILQCQVTRDELEKWMFAPFLNDTVLRGFVRLGIGMDKDRQYAYRLCQIIEVIEYHRTYKINGILTKKALKVKHGKAEKIFLMDVVSNQAITEAEFTRWLRTMSAEQIPVPPFSEIQRVQRHLEDARAHVFTNQEIDSMIEERQRLVPVPRNLANHKLQLIAKIEEAKTDGRYEDAQELQKELDNVEQTMTDQHSEKYDGSKAQLWAQLNERNRRKNLEEGRSSELRIREEKQQLKKEGKTLDPFARIKAIETIHLIVNTDNLNNSTEQLSSEPQSGQQSARSGGSGLITPNEHQTSTELKANGNGAAALDKVFAEIDVDIDI